MTQPYKVVLSADVHNKLAGIAALRSLTLREAFERELGNGINIYSNIEIGGMIRLVDPLGNVQHIRLMPNESPAPLPLCLRWLQRSPRKVTIQTTQYSFETGLDESTIQTIDTLASVWGFTAVDMVNRLIDLACAVEEELAQHKTAYLIDSENKGLGPIAFV